MASISVRGVLLGATVAALSSLSLAQAKADDATPNAQVAQAPMAMPMGYNWTGFYLGLVTGGGSGSSRQTDTSGATSGTYKESGGLVGGTVGYNWEMNNFLPIPAGGVILGVESDISATNITGKTYKPGCTAGGNTSCQTNVPWFNTDRVRAGIAWDRFFPFITGGLAVGSVHAGQNPCAPLAPPSSFCATNTRVGWTVGTGVEAKLAPEWSVKLDYLHVDLGTTQQYTVAIPVNVSQTMDVVRIGLNFQFGVPTPPPAMTPVAAPPPPAVMAPSKQMFIVFFEFDKSSLTPDGKKVVDAAAAAFKSGKSDIALAGYTDLSGTQQYNLALSHRRADTVKAALVKDGVAASAIGESWYGKQNPRVPTADGVREPQNRRVEITM